MNTNVVLRDVIESDLPIFFEHQLDEDAVKMAAFPSRDRDSFMAHWAKIRRDEKNILKAILFEGQVAGNVVSWEQGSERWVGYRIGRAYWGRGVATQALRALLEQIKVRPIYAYVAKHNIGSIRVLEKCGFVRVSEAEGEFLMKLG